MNVDIRANGDPETSHVVEDWPHEWRLPVVGEQIDIKGLSSTTLEVARVLWVKESRDGGTYWGVQLWVWGPALRAREPGS